MIKKILIIISAIVLAYAIVFCAVNNAIDNKVSVAITEYMDTHTLQVNCE